MAEMQKQNTREFISSQVRRALLGNGNYQRLSTSGAGSFPCRDGKAQETAEKAMNTCQHCHQPLPEPRKARECYATYYPNNPYDKFGGNV